MRGFIVIFYIITTATLSKSSLMELEAKKIQVTLKPEASRDSIGYEQFIPQPRSSSRQIQPEKSSRCSNVHYSFASSGQSAFLQSRNYPFHYPYNQNCSYFISSPAGTRMKFSCNMNIACPNDSLYFDLNGSSTFSGAKYHCGRKKLPSQTTISNQLSIGFHSGNKRPLSFFSYKYRFTVSVIGTEQPIAITTRPNSTTSRPTTVPPPTTYRPTTVPPPTTYRPTTVPPPTTYRPTTVPPPTTSRPTIVPPPSTSRPTTVPPPSTSGPTIVPPPTTSCSCGVRNVNGANSRIVGGVQTKAGEIPWRARVLVLDPLGGTYLCGGTIINPNWVLTAAHCTMRFKKGYKIIVSTGSVAAGGGERNEVNYFIQHPFFNLDAVDNDIALLHLSQPLTFAQHVSAACLPFGSLSTSEFSGASVLASGWGTTRPVAAGVANKDPTSKTLMEVILPVLTTDQCREYQTITNNQICTYQPPKGVCQGDSGGSIDYKNTDGRYYSIGIVSWGYGCAQTGFPAVHTKVTNYLNWIKSSTEESFCE